MAQSPRVRRLLVLLVSALGWVGFALVTLWAVVFLADVVVPRTVDGTHRLGAAAAVVTDVGLLLLFAVQHSVMARYGFKTWLRRRIPVSLERAVYVLTTDVVLGLLLVCWQPFGGSVWQFDGAAAAVLWGIYGVGWVWAVAATFAVDHLELVGMRQAGWCATAAGKAAGLQTQGLHALVRHPLMTGLLVTVWATPHLGASHLLYALGVSTYIAIGIRFEERDLRRTFGAAYDEYAGSVGAVLPRLTVRDR